MIARGLLFLTLALAAPLPLHAEGRRVFDTPGYTITLERRPDVDSAPWQASVVDKRDGSATVWSFDNPSTNWYEVRVAGTRAILLGRVGELTDTVAILDLGAGKERAAWYGSAPAVSPDGRYVAYVGQKPAHGPESERPDELFVADLSDEPVGRGVRVFRLDQPGATAEAAEAINRDAGLLWLHGGRDLAFLADAPGRLRLLVARLGSGPKAARVVARDVDLAPGGDPRGLHVHAWKAAGEDGVVIELRGGSAKALRSLAVPLPQDGEKP